MLSAQIILPDRSAPDLDPEMSTLFPLHIQISSTFAEKSVSGDSALKGEAMGAAAPFFVIYHGTMNGEDHWVFECQRENRFSEVNPCTDLPIGEYRGRWIHDHNLVQVLGGDSTHQIARYWIVSPNPKSPPAPADDSVYQFPTFEFLVSFPAGKSVGDYPAIVHVYGAVTLNFQVGQLPASNRCTATTWSAYQSTVNCTSYPPIPINRGYVTLQVSAERVDYGHLSCDAKWKWSKCAAVAPGFYYARVDKKDRLVVLVHNDKGEPSEITFEANF